jgi:hypothetical protein
MPRVVARRAAYCMAYFRCVFGFSSPRAAWHALAASCDSLSSAAWRIACFSCDLCWLCCVATCISWALCCASHQPHALDVVLTKAPKKEREKKEEGCARYVMPHTSRMLSMPATLNERNARIEKRGGGRKREALNWLLKKKNPCQSSERTEGAWVS